METVKQKTEKILSARRITRSDQKELMLIFSQGRLTSSDRDLIDRLHTAINQGMLRVVD